MKRHIVLFVAAAFALSVVSVEAQTSGAAGKEWSFAQADSKRFIDSVGYKPKVQKLTIQTTNRVIPEGNTVDKWLEKQLGVQIDWIILSGADLSTKINLLSASKQLPDVVSLPSTSNATDYSTLVKDGALIDLESLLNKWGKNIKAVRSKDQIEVLRNPDGRLYALNSVVETDYNMNVIRKDWLDKLGLKIPTTTKEFRDTMAAFVNKDPDGNGKADTFGYYGWKGGTNTFSMFWSAFGANPYQWVWGDKGTIVYGATKTEQLIKAVAYIQKMYADGLLNKDYLTAEIQNYQDMATANRQGSTETQLWYSDHYMQPQYLYGNNDPKTDWVCLPGLDGGSYLTFNNPSVRQYTCITADSKDPDLAMLYLELLAHKDVYHYIRLGVEGVQYARDAKSGVDKLTDVYLKDGNKLISEGFTATYAMPFLPTDPAPGQFTERTETFRQARRAGEKASYAAMYFAVPQIQEQKLNAGMQDYINQVINETIMDAGKDPGIQIKTMVDTLTSKYHLQAQTQAVNEYAKKLGISKK